ncbi:CDP-glycerol glycerophosphotransferase family protein [Brevibacterium sp. 1718]|uniref:CDP-glycerol glycerophosphotransferase family protein n=1 Tax=Brevibacterium sp. 1718 TaxID=3413510 RepID=UPI003DA920EF
MNRLGNGKRSSILKQIHERCSDPSHAYDYGLALLRENKLEDANFVLSHCSRVSGATAEWKYRHAIVFERLKRYDEAISLLSEASSIKPNVSEYRYRLGVCFAAKGKHEEAFYNFEAAIELNPQDDRAAKRLTRSLSQSVPLWRRFEVLANAVQAVPDARNLMLDYATTAFWLRKYEMAASAYRRASHLGELDYKALYRYAKSREQLGGDPTELYSRAIAESKKAWIKRLGVGALHEDQSDPLMAIAAYKRDWHTGRSSAELAFRIGSALERTYDWKAAYEWFQSAISLEPGVAYRQYKLALAAERVGEYLKAINSYKLAAALDSDKGKYWLFRAGLCAIRLGNQEDGFGLLMASYGASVAGIVDGQQSHEAAESEATLDGWIDPSILEIGHRTPGIYSESATLARSLGKVSESLPLFNKYLDREEPRNRELIAAAATEQWQNGHRSKSIDTLISGRAFKDPDGLDVRSMTKSTQARRTSVYAEYRETCPIDDSAILYESYWGKTVSCHPFAIYKRLRERPEHKSFKHIWVVQKSADIPDALVDDKDVIFVQYGSDKYLKYLATARYLINNTSFVPYFTRRRGQYYLNTWHGTPLKTLGRSVSESVTEHFNITRNLLQATHLMAPNEHTRDVLLRDFDIEGISSAPIEIIGSPRLDQLVNSTVSDSRRVRDELGIDSGDGRKIILYAPTWRGSNSSRELDVSQLRADLNFLNTLEGFIVYFRGHHLTEDKLDGSDIDARVVPSSMDTYTMLAATDILITDYSSLLFDFLVTGRPAVAYVPDLEEYKSERGLYLSPDDIVSQVASDHEELERCILESNDMLSDPKYIASKEMYAGREDGQSSDRAIDYLFSEIEVQSSVTKQKVIGLFASLYPNGITGAMRDLINTLPEDRVRVVIFADATNTNHYLIDEFLTGVKRRVQVVTRSGLPVFTLRERQAYTDLQRWRQFGSPHHHRILTTAFAREYCRLVGDASLDSVMQFEGYSTYWTALLGSIDSAKTQNSIYLHNEMEKEISLKYPYLAEVFQWLDDYSHVASVSEPVAGANEEFLHNAGYLSTGKSVTWLRNVIDVERVLTMAESLPSEPLAQGSPLLVAAGRLSVEKNHELLIEMMPTLLETAPGARLVIMGDGPLRSKLEATARQLGVADSVQFLGHVTNPYPYIKAANCFLLPSLHEGQPVVLFEALALGTPFVAAPTPGTRDLTRLVGLDTTEPNVRSFVSAINEVCSRGSSPSVNLDVVNRESLKLFGSILAID